MACERCKRRTNAVRLFLFCGGRKGFISPRHLNLSWFCSPDGATGENPGCNGGKFKCWWFVGALRSRIPAAPLQLSCVTFKGVAGEPPKGSSIRVTGRGSPFSCCITDRKNASERHCFGAFRGSGFTRFGARPSILATPNIRFRQAVSIVQRLLCRMNKGFALCIANIFPFVALSHLFPVALALGLPLVFVSER